MRYHNITTDDMLNGDGLRTVLWVAGREHRCRGCHNPITWDIDGGIPFDEAAEQELFEKLSADYISGITFSGCDLEIIPLLDVLVDGKYVEAVRDPKLHWKGSSNQRVIDVQETLRLGNVVLFD